MLKKYILITAVFGSATSYASSPVDSIGVENNNGKKLIIHKVDPKESYYSISRRYNVNVKDLQAYNNNASLQIGSIVKVPTNLPFAEKPLSKTAAGNGNVNFFDYTVAAKDNLNLIAEKFATNVAEIKKLNNLSSNNLSIGQVLKVPFVKGHTPATETNSSHQEDAKVSDEITVTEHIVKPKEFLGLIAKQYGVTVEELKQFNGLSSNNLSIGQTLKIPTKNEQALNNAATTPTATIATPTPAATTKKSVENNPVISHNTSPTKTDPSFEHVVAIGETIYSIAQKYQLTTYQLKNFNNLTSNELTVGQKLIIKGEKPSTIASASANDDDEATENPETLKNPNLKRPAAVYGLNKIEEKGTGVWISDPDLDANKMLILHRTAPIGTIIQITNPMTNRSTFAKVVGKFTENETTKDVIIVMTKAVADAVGALDRRFFCNLTYGPKDNEK